MFLGGIVEFLANYFLYFIIYAFLGWSMEVICKLFEQKKFINRGFLVGPICPIYGYGVLAIVLVIGSIKGDILAVFLKSILVCSLLEYLTSYLMEKFFKARWWDYSRRKFNLNGRICLETMIPFGLLGLFVIYVLHPIVTTFVLNITYNLKITISIILLCLYIFDNIFSYVVLKNIKDEIVLNSKDNTEEIKTYIKTWLKNNSIFYRRVITSYPNFLINIKHLNINKVRIKRK